MPINSKQSERVEIELMQGDRVAMCRCWQSKKFPYCDGSHRAFNQENNENLGPCIVKVSQSDLIEE